MLKERNKCLRERKDALEMRMVEKEELGVDRWIDVDGRTSDTTHQHKGWWKDEKIFEASSPITGTG